MMTGADLVHVPHRGSYLTDLMSGQVQGAFTASAIRMVSCWFAGIRPPRSLCSRTGPLPQSDAALHALHRAWGTSSSPTFVNRNGLGACDHTRCLWRRHFGDTLLGARQKIGVLGLRRGRAIGGTNVNRGEEYEADFGGSLKIESSKGASMGGAPASHQLFRDFIILTCAMMRVRVIVQRSGKLVMTRRLNR